MKINYSIKLLGINEFEKYRNEIYRLFKENTQGHENKIIISEEYIKTKFCELENYFKSNNLIFLGCEFENNIIGFLWAYERIFIEEKRIYVNSFIIDDKYRSFGIGTSLLKILEEIAKQRNIKVIDVSTSTFKENTIEFYMKNNFMPERIQLRKEIK